MDAQNLMVPVRSLSYEGRCANTPDDLSDQDNSGHQKVYFVERSLKGRVNFESMDSNHNIRITDGCAVSMQSMHSMQLIESSQVKRGLHRVFHSATDVASILLQIYDTLRVHHVLHATSVNPTYK